MKRCRDAVCRALNAFLERPVRARRGANDGGFQILLKNVLDDPAAIYEKGVTRCRVGLIRGIRERTEAIYVDRVGHYFATPYSRIAPDAIVSPATLRAKELDPVHGRAYGF